MNYLRNKSERKRLEDVFGGDTGPRKERVFSDRDVPTKEGGMVVILIPLTIVGIAHIGRAVIGHEGSTLAVVFNALRLLAYKK